MSVQSEIDRIITAVGNAYSKVSEKGGTVPSSQTVANLATAIDSIPAGGAPSLQTWVIKDTAPVDDASLTLETTNISFTTNNEKATSIGIVQDVSIVMLIYGGVDVVAQFDVGASDSFEWYNEAYKKLEFDTAPTGELLAWLQKNADEQTELNI